MLQKNAWPGHYPKGSAVSKIGSYFLEELFRVFFISNEWCLQLRLMLVEGLIDLAKELTLLFQ